MIEQDPKIEITIDLEDQIIELEGFQEKFEINAYKKECMIHGYDDIDYLLNLREEITDFDLMRG